MPQPTIVVSGAGTGIGRAVARRLATDKAHVTAIGRRREPLADLAAGFTDLIDVVPADVAVTAGAASVAAHVAAAGRPVAGVVCAAGGLSPTGALHGWVYDLASELGRHGGTANVVAPGFVPDTEFWAAGSPRSRASSARPRRWSGGRASRTRSPP